MLKVKISFFVVLTSKRTTKEDVKHQNYEPKAHQVNISPQQLPQHRLFALLSGSRVRRGMSDH